jgi:hypothetical protein
MQKIKIAFVLFCLIFSSISYGKETCPISSVKVDKFKAINDKNYVTSVIGVLVNNCNISVGIQIKVVFYDKDENILRVQDGWPASINNIQPQTSYPFQFSVDKVEGFTKTTVQVIEVKQW